MHEINLLNEIFVQQNTTQFKTEQILDCFAELRT